MADTPVLIAGAGPTGLVLAIWLTRLGVKVRIIDKASEPGTTSRALAVQARTLELYHQVGLDDAVIAGGVKIQNINLWVKGRRAATVPLTGAGGESDAVLIRARIPAGRPRAAADRAACRARRAGGATHGTAAIHAA